MTKEEAKEFLPIIQAFVEGKTIQYYYGEFDGWKDCFIIRFDESVRKYRIKPEKETTRLTYHELSQLLKCFGVDYTWGCMTSCHNSINPSLVEEDEKIPEGYKIRYRQGELEEPTRETVWKWWGEETAETDISRFISFMGWDEDKEWKK